MQLTGFTSPLQFKRKSGYGWRGPAHGFDLGEPLASCCVAAGTLRLKHNHRLRALRISVEPSGWKGMAAGSASAPLPVPGRNHTRMTDHYTTLGLSSAATLAEVKKAFRQKASFWHPDKNAAPDAPARFQAVQQAYEVLSDAERRQAYDDNRRRNLLDSPLETAQEIWQNYFNLLL